MKNLKKVLALGLSAAMALSMFVTGAGAAFTDQADIKASEAVDMLSALGVINGNPDGSFKPDGTVTRAEMAKMIYVLRTGKDSAAAFESGSTSFTDINGHWAAGYIKYCQSMGIIAGKSATQFDPDNTVTGTEAAKMLLVTAGYKADKAGLVGTGWDAKTKALADENGLFDDVDTPIDAACPRQYAAQLIYNAIDADTVYYDGDEVKKTSSEKQEEKRLTDGSYQYVTVTENETVGEKYMNLEKTDIILREISYDDAKNQYSINNGAYTKVAKDYSDMMGQKVTVLHEKNKSDKVFGVYVHSDSSVIGNGIVDNLDTVSGDTYKVKFDGTEYKLDSTIATNIVMNFNASTATNSLSGLIASGNKIDQIKLIDNDGDSKIDTAILIPRSVYKLTYVGSSTVTIAGIGGVPSLGSKNVDDITGYEGMAKDDFVIVTPATNTVAGKMLLAKVDKVTGTIDAIKDTSKVQVDGTWYSKGSNSATTLGTGNLGSNVDLYVVDGFYYEAEASTNVGSTDVLFVSATKSALDTDYGDTTLEAKVYFTDGSTKTVTIDEVNYLASGTTWTAADPALGRLVGTSGLTNQTANAYTESAAVMEGMMYRYTTTKNGNYQLYVLADNSTDRAGYKKYEQVIADNSTTGANLNTDSNRLTVASSMTVSDDAKIFVQNTKSDGSNASVDDVKVITGKALKNWSSSAAAIMNRNVTTAQALADTKNGASTIQIGALNIAAAAFNIGGGDGDSYGYVTAVTLGKRDGSTVVNYTIWNGTEAKTYFEDTSSIKVTKGKGIKYSVVSDEEIEVDGTAVFTPYAIKSVDGSYLDLADANGTVTTAALKVDSDTKVLYINSKDTKGVESSGYPTADNDGTNYTLNAYAVTTGLAEGDSLDVILIDINNKLDGAAYTAKLDSTTTASKNSVTYTMSGTAVDSADDASKAMSNIGFAVKAGKTITITVTPDSAVAAGTTSTVTITNSATGEAKSVSFVNSDGTTAKSVTFVMSDMNAMFSIS